MSLHSSWNVDAFLEQSAASVFREESVQQWNQEWVGCEIDSYRLEEVIGTGAHGVVFRARRIAPYERLVAIKLLPYLQGKEKASRFHNECQAMADVEHPGISQILTAGLTEDGIPYLVMPLIRGVSVDEYARQQTHELAYSDIAGLIKQLTSAVAFAHRNGVLHCDLTPDNILVDDAGAVTITDFGLAVRFEQMDELSQRPSWAPGTMGYAAPEILFSRERASPASDIYSIGAVLYALLVGEPPCYKPGWVETAVANASARPEPVRANNPDIPEGLAEICDKCLATKPGDRFAAAAELESQLTDFIDGLARPRHSMKLRVKVGVAIAIAVATLSWGHWLSQLQKNFGADADSEQIEPVSSLAESEVENILRQIEEQLLRPGLRDPAKPGDFERTFEILKDASKQLDSLLAQAPGHRKVRHRTATGYFLLGRAAHWVDEREYADQSLARSEQMFRQLHREYPEDGFMFDFFHTIIVQASRASPVGMRDLHLMALGVIEGLRASDKNNLDYSDAHACTLVALAQDYTVVLDNSLVNFEMAEPYAQEALEIAEWTCNQPGSIPLHRKHIMTSTSVLGDIAGFRGKPDRAVELAKIAHAEAIRLDEKLNFTDLKHHVFDKKLKLAGALQAQGRLKEAQAFIEPIDTLVEELRELGWPQIELCEAMASGLKNSLIKHSE